MDTFAKYLWTLLFVLLAGLALLALFHATTAISVGSVLGLIPVGVGRCLLRMVSMLALTCALVACSAVAFELLRHNGRKLAIRTVALLALFGILGAGLFLSTAGYDISQISNRHLISVSGPASVEELGAHLERGGFAWGSQSRGYVYVRPLDDDRTQRALEWIRSQGWNATLSAGDMDVTR